MPSLRIRRRLFVFVVRLLRLGLFLLGLLFLFLRRIRIHVDLVHLRDLEREFCIRVLGLGERINALEEFLHYIVGVLGVGGLGRAVLEGLLQVSDLLVKLLELRRGSRAVCPRLRFVGVIFLGLLGALHEALAMLGFRVVP